MKKITLLLCTFTALAFTFLAPDRSFQGVVTDSQSKAPLKGVMVTAFDHERQVAQATTQANGIFTMKLGSGQYTFEFSKNNYETLRLVEVPGAYPDDKQLKVTLEPSIVQRQHVTALWSLQQHSIALVEESSCRIRGQLIDAADKSPLIWAVVVASKPGKPNMGTQADMDGRYALNLSPGTYTLTFSYTGYSSKTITDVTIRAGQELQYDIEMGSNTSVLDEVVVVGAERRESTRDKRRTRDAGAPKEAKKSKSAEPRREKSSPGKSPAPTTEAMPAPMVAKPVPVAEALKDAEVIAVPDEVTSALFWGDTDVQANQPAAGILTAGEWNDLDNWSKHWKDLITDGEIDDFQKIYGFYPHHRYTVLLQNEQGFPVIDAPIILSDEQGRAVWEARTDNTGKAELWYSLFEPKETGHVLKLHTILDGKTQPLGMARPYEQGINQYKIQRECQAPKLLDIVWAVDATGSMSDEIDFLKNELTDVIRRVQNNNKDLTVRMGSVFYRDNTDAYLVKSSGLSPNISNTVAYINDQYADGGGDMPEAVHSALDEVVYRQKWSDDAVARICFLVLDASPHQSPEVTAQIRTTIREAARKGIRVVPVSASGVEKDTEFLMKFFGLATNGSYVFLTDDSGVGNKHLAPTTDEYKVEPFNDLLVRIITQYSTVATCDGKSLVLFERQGTPDQQTTAEPLPVASYFPNPATDILNLDLPFDAKKITLYNAEGTAVTSLANVAKGRHVFSVNQLPAGYYSLRIWAENQVQSGKVLVVKM